jgi:hypothetical protein
VFCNFDSSSYGNEPRKAYFFFVHLKDISLLNILILFCKNVSTLKIVKCRFFVAMTTPLIWLNIVKIHHTLRNMAGNLKKIGILLNNWLFSFNSNEKNVISQLIRYARACSTYDQVLVRGNLLTDKLMSRGFQLSRLQAAFRKFYGRYNDLICPYNLSLGHMLSDMFHTNC